jgi:hypothetical protein
MGHFKWIVKYINQGIKNNYMEIKIDTHKDSPDHIKKMIEFLQKFVGETSNSTENTGFTNIFGEDNSIQNVNQEKSSSMFNLFSDDNPTVNELNERKDFSLNDELNSSIQIDEEEQEEPTEKINIIPY